MRKFNLIFLLILTISLVSALPYTNIIIKDPTGLTNYSCYLNQTVYIEQGYNVTSAGKIQIYNISSNSSDTPFIYANNETYKCAIEFYNLPINFNDVNYSNNTLNTYSSSINTFNISITPGQYFSLIGSGSPIVNLITPLNNTSGISISPNFSYNVSDSELKNSTLNIYNQTGLFYKVSNFFTGAVTTTVSYVVALPIGIYNWWVEAWDDSGNTFTTENYTITSGAYVTSDGNFIIKDFNLDGVTDFTSKEFNYNITVNNTLSTLKWNWNSTNYTLYDSSLVLFYNFNNFSSLGENDTLVKDISKYGNNGTVYGGANITWTNNGKYNGAFNFSGGVNYIDLDSNENLLETESNYSFCAWFYTKETDRQGIVSDRRSLNDVNYTFFGLSSTNKVYLECKNDVTATKVLSYDTIGLNEWYHICGIFDSSGLRIYINGSLDNSSTGNCVYNKTNAYTIKVGSYYDFSKSYATNGSIDNLMIWNRSLSASEISMLYNVSLTKFNSTNCEFYANVSIKNEYLSTTNLNEVYNYGLYVNDTAGNSNSTSNTITRVPLLTSTLGNFTTNLGNVRSDFYGVNSKSFPSDLTEIDADDDGTLETASNETWHKEKLLESKLTYLRTAMFLVDSSTGDGTFATSGYANINMKADIVKFAYDNGGKVMLIASGMPNWLANATTGWCNSSVSNLSCPPTNYIKYGELVVDYIDNVTNNGLYNSSIEIEIGNEPDGSSWLNNLSVDNVTKSIEFNKLYNATYDAIKVKYPTIKVGGFGGGSLTFDHPVIYYNFLGNFSDKIDFFSFHKYQSGTGATMMDSTLDAYYDKIISNFSTYNVNCSRIILSETNTYNSTIQNSSSYVNLNGMQFGLIYLGGLNTFAKNLSIMPYTWELQYIYGTNQPEYPYKFQFVSEPELDNEINIPFNVTKNFATYCPSGSTVYASSSNNSYLKTVTCHKGNSNNIIVINTDTETKNVTLNLSSMPSTIRDYSTKTAYTSSSNTRFGLVDSYNILYLGNGIYGEYNGAYWNRPLNEITESNVNLTTILKNTDTVSRTIEIANMTNALVYFGNLSSALSTNINSNDNGFNITVPSNINISMLNHFNLTEGYNRVNSPVWISSKSDIPGIRTYAISSNFSETFDNLTFIVSSACPNSVTYKSNTSVYQFNPSFSCVDGLVVINLEQIEPAINSNLVYLYYSTSPGGGGGGGASASSTSNLTNQTNITSIPIITGNETDINQTIPSSIIDRYFKDNTLLWIIIGVVFAILVFIILVISLSYKSKK